MRLAPLLLTGLSAAGLTAVGAGLLFAQPAAPPINASSTSIVRTDRTLSGQPLKLPQGRAEVVASALEIPSGGATAIHQHPWSRFVYVERGPVRIVNHDTGQSTDLQSGQFFPEVIAQWHEGQAVGPASARLVVIDLVPPGVSNMVMKGPSRT